MNQKNYHSRIYNRDWSPYLRDFKLGIVTGDVELHASQVALKRFDGELSFIKDEFPDDVITGSLVLNLFGLLDREISDIDIIIKDSKRYSGYAPGLYYGMAKGNETAMESRLGYLVIEHRKKGFWNWMFPKKYKVDFFEESNARFLEVEYGGHVYKVQHPIDILEEKSNIAGIKHFRDLLCILE